MSSTTASSGMVLGPYVLESELGRGGMGVVYRALDTRLGRAVALKLVQRGVAHEIGLAVPDLRARLRKEAQLGARITHPNVVTVYAYEEVGDDSLVAMELVEGPTLAELLAGGKRWGPREAAQLLSQAADGIAAAHALGIVHRDLKPANLILTRDGRCKVLDFGIAKLTTADGAQSLSRTTFGTVQYMSPEQILGHQTGTATDVWSLGTIAYELVTGETLFSRTSAITSATQITRGVRFETGAQWTTPNDQAVVFAQEVGALFPFLQHALQVDPRARLRDGGDARDALLTSCGVSPTPTPWMPATSASTAARRDPRVAIMLVALLVLLLVVALGIIFLLQDRIPASASRGFGGGGMLSAATAFAPAAAAPVPAIDSAAIAARAAASGMLYEVKMIGDANGYRFEPADFTLTQYDAVRFVTVSGGPHNVAFDPSALRWDSRAALSANMQDTIGELSGRLLLTTGESYEMSFAGVPTGTYEFFCTPHLAMNMKGTVTVTVLGSADTTVKDTTKK
ncbi:MAG: protein kinase [Gemmatimonas sp.]